MIFWSYELTSLTLSFTLYFPRDLYIGSSPRSKFKYQPHLSSCKHHSYYSDVIMGVMAPQITSLTIVYSTVYTGADQIKHQSSASLAFVLGIHRWSVNSPHKWPVTRKMFPFDDISMIKMKRLWLWDHLIFMIGLPILITHGGRDKMAANFLATISNAFSSMKIYKFQLRFHWSLFARVQLTITQH